MKKTKLLALVLAAAMIMGIFAGCSSNSDDVLATVGNQTVYRWYYQLYLNQSLEQYRQYTGVDLTRQEYAEQYASYKETLLEDLVGEAAALQKAIDEGYGELTAADEAEIDADYEEYYQQQIQSYMAEYGTDDAGRRKAEEAFDQWMKKNNLTPERIMTYIVRKEHILDKYYQSITAYGEVTEEEIQEAYDSYLETQKNGCEEDPAYFGDNSPAVIVYYPEGYVRTKIMTIPFNTKDQTTIGEAAQAFQSAAAAVLSALEEAENDAENAVVKRKQNDMEKALNAYNNSVEKGYSNIMSAAEDVVARLDAGEAWSDVVADVLPDDFQSDWYISKDTTSVEETIRDAALELTEEGSHSDILKTGSGLTIVELEEFVEARTVPVEEVSEQIANLIRSSRTFSESTRIRLECVQEAEAKGLVTRYLDRL